MQLPKRYDSKESEKKWQEKWEEWKIYRFNPDSDKKIYSIDTPPPTMSGDMHLGHAFSYSQMDFIARFKRMSGYNLFYPFGTDDNGLATDRMIERMKKVRAKDIGRKEYVRLALDTLDEIRPSFIHGWRNIAVSVDWSLYYSTINNHCQKISQKSFIDIYRMGRAYRKETPFIWCPSCQTAIAQVELEDKELESRFVDIVFKAEGKDLIIATTRPEMLSACVAVFVHPDDRRYTNLTGKKAKVPIYNHEVPIISDKRADPEKGTGMVMCCTFGDQTDIEWYKAHNLPLKAAITEDGKMTKLAGRYAGMKIRDARKQIITDLEEAGLLIKEKKITHPVNVHERCGTEVEILNTKQWFVKYLDLKKKFLELGKDINWLPGHMRNRYDNWVKGLQWDWCISRQRYFGVPFPLWYCKKCSEVKMADESQLPVDPLADKPKTACDKCGNNDFVPEEDVLDTWMTSSLTPDLAIELVKDEQVRKRLRPMSLRAQAHDIISFWLFNTVVKSHFHQNNIPWKNAMISGWALDPRGRKMSKSRGNVIEPQKMTEKYSADALRYWAASSKLGEDLPFLEKELVTGQKFITKLWNASKFAIMNLDGYDSKAKKNFTPVDKWILSKLNILIKSSTEAFNEYKYAKVKADVEKFFWQDFADNYIEIAKDRLYNPENYEKGAKEAAQFCLYNVVLNVLKMMAPFVPFITEEIYQLHFAGKEKKKSIHVSEWPEYDSKLIDSEAMKCGETAKRVIAELRQYKNENNLALNTPVEKITIETKIEAIKELADDIKGTMKINEIVFGSVKEAGIMFEIDGVAVRIEIGKILEKKD